MLALDGMLLCKYYLLILIYSLYPKNCDGLHFSMLFAWSNLSFMLSYIFWFVDVPYKMPREMQDDIFHVTQT
jgi:hypothetical protein